MSAPRPKILKQYSNYTGRRFAAVQFPDGRRVDVLVRGPKDGSQPNDWGEYSPYHESRTGYIVAKALELLEAQTRAKGKPSGAGGYNVTANRPRRTRAGKAARKAARKAGRFVAAEMRALKRGSKRVRSRKQAVAVGLSRARAAGVKVPRPNPPLVVVNPPYKVRAVLGKALELRYRHASDGRLYKHAFAPGKARIQLLEDGSIRVVRSDGKTLWGDF